MQNKTSLAEAGQNNQVNISKFSAGAFLTISG
jgi:hypothetical protein